MTKDQVLREKLIDDTNIAANKVNVRELESNINIKNLHNHNKSQLNQTHNQTTDLNPNDLNPLSAMNPTQHINPLSAMNPISSINPIPNLNQIMHDYDIFLIDIWGTLYDGQNQYKDAMMCLLKLKLFGKKVILFTNYPSSAQELVQELPFLSPEFYTSIFTSGKCFEILFNDKLSQLEKKHQKKDQTFKVFFISNRPKKWFKDNIKYQQAHNLDEASLVILEDFPNESMHLNHSLLTDYAKSLASYNKPIICLNPDRHTLLENKLIYKIGELAYQCELLGADVKYIGKPNKSFYETCALENNFALSDKVIMIGDNLDTDIAGAISANIDSLLVTDTGIYSSNIDNSDKADSLNKKYLEKMRNSNIYPTYIVDKLS